MKNILILITLLLTANAFGQYGQNIHIDPNRSPGEQQILVSWNGKDLLSNKRLRNTAYVQRGHFANWALTDFADAISQYLNIADLQVAEDAVTYDSVAVMISDSLATVSSDNIATANLTATGDRELNMNNNTFLIWNATSTTLDTDAAVGANSYYADIDEVTLFAAGGATIKLTAVDGTYTIANLPEFADDTAAGVGGLAAGRLYRTATGVLMVKL